MSKQEEGSPAFGNYPHLNTPPKKGERIDLPKELWGAADENGLVSEERRTIVYLGNPLDDLDPIVRKRLHNEAHGTFEDDQEFLEFSKVGEIYFGYNYHETGMSPNPIDSPQLVHHCDALMYAKTYTRLANLGVFADTKEGHALEFTFRIARYMSHGVFYSRYVTNKDGELQFITVKEESIL
ncbi:hypothetical protein [Ewingella americana]|uniref:Uncharacterized protein n=1 Tax=Ewingella americana TaxID=41202 RepID=A0A502GF33_9GAMM|nr:hypothetical protein [Ewingella americana]TPG60148.1 hypothetical protein EAH77_16395 [Ewingella americana]